MKIAPIIRDQFEDIFDPLGIDFVESGLESMKWTCTKALSDLEQIIIGKSYTIEILLPVETYGELFEDDLSTTCLLEQLKTANAINFEATEETEKNRVKVTFETNMQLIGGC